MLFILEVVSVLPPSSLCSDPSTHAEAAFAGTKMGEERGRVAGSPVSCLLQGECLKGPLSLGAKPGERGRRPDGPGLGLPELQAWALGMVWSVTTRPIARVFP